jgi:hypothetical protein
LSGIILKSVANIHFLIFRCDRMADKLKGNYRTGKVNHFPNDQELGKKRDSERK